MSFLLIIPTNATYINIDGMKGNFYINNDSIKTYSTSVNINLNLSGVTEMKFGNTILERDSASWESYSTSKSWTLNSGEGKKTVYARFKNASGDTINITDDIILKDSLPYITGLTVWLDAYDNSTITSSGGNISSWNDKSGNNYHAKQNSVTNQANLLTNEIDFNGTSDYFYLENLNYINSSPLDGLLTCAVFKTPNTNTSLSGNWAFIDFDRSEWFNFYNRGDGIGFSYDAGGIQDIYVSGVGINDNQFHVSCASYDNTQVNDTIITIDGVTQYSNNLEGFGSQIGVGQATRYGFIGDGSEAPSENGGRNNLYYDGGIAEIVLFDSIVNSSDRADIECYLGDKWGIDIASCSDSIKPISTINYSPEFTTSSNVISSLTNNSENITITNNSGSSIYTFTSTGSFTFEYQDINGNTGSTEARVDWIDLSAPTAIGSGSLNEAPSITSYSGSSSKTLKILSGATDIATIKAVDTFYNVVGEYGNSNLSGNNWLEINTYEMCSPVVTVSHRQDVNGEIQRSPRVRNKTSTGFEVHVDNYNSTIGVISTEIDYMVINSGSHDFGGGLLIEANSETTSEVACNASNSPTPNTVNFTTSFISAPSVIHTISTENDSTWVVSGVNGDTGNRGTEPSITKMGTVLQRSFNSCTHATEDVDYIAIEPGTYTLLDGTTMDTTVSSDSIGAIDPIGYPITFNTVFGIVPQTVLVSQLGEDGGNGGYSSIHTGGGVLSNLFYVTIDEDGPSADRNHTNEVAASLAFDKSNGQFWETNSVIYSITGGLDSLDFNINPTNGELTFITGKSPINFLDSNTDGIYEVIISACDTHCNSKCSTQTILADTRDLITPIISGSNILSGALLPGGNHVIDFNYSDEVGGSEINTLSGVIELYKWNGSIWGPDISNTGFGTGTITSVLTSYPTLNLDYGKYKVLFNISDKAGNISIGNEVVFYIDRPEFIINTSEIDIGVIEPFLPYFSPEVSVTVKTIGAGFSVFLNRNTDLNEGTDIINSYGGIEGYGFDKEVYTGSVNTINTNEIIATQTGSINIDGNLNTYIYKLKIGALINLDQIAGDYEGTVDFGIQLDY